jgi:type II secretory pathway predicted ATPase ExeA
MWADLGSLLEGLCQRNCEPLASRVIGRLHLAALDEVKTREYVKHHLNVAGSKKDLFNDAAHSALQFIRDQQVYSGV